MNLGLQPLVTAGFLLPMTRIWKEVVTKPRRWELESTFVHIGDMAPYQARPRPGFYKTKFLAPTQNLGLDDHPLERWSLHSHQPPGAAAGAKSGTCRVCREQVHPRTREMEIVFNIPGRPLEIDILQTGS